MTLAEISVITPVHAFVRIFRTGTGIPRLIGGTQAFLLLEPIVSESIPWQSFSKLPFVVLTSKSSDPEKLYQTTVDLKKILLFFRFMSQLKEDPLHPGQYRTYNRLVGECNSDGLTFNWSSENFKKLQEELESRDAARITYNDTELVRL